MLLFRLKEIKLEIIKNFLFTVTFLVLDNYCQLNKYIKLDLENI
jgi:hypothetical protein